MILIYYNRLYDLLDSQKLLENKTQLLFNNFFVQTLSHQTLFLCLIIITKYFPLIPTILVIVYAFLRFELNCLISFFIPHDTPLFL